MCGGIWDISLCATIDISSQYCCEMKTAVKNSLAFFLSDSGSHSCSQKKKKTHPPKVLWFVRKSDKPPD